MKLRSYFIFVMAAGLLRAAFGQTEVQQGVRYESNSYLRISSLGISFIIPNGWYGGVAAGSPFMVLADASNEVNIIITADEMKEQEISGKLQQQISLDERISLIPVSAVTKEGRRWWGDYKLKGSENMQCYMEVALGNYHIGAGCVVIAFPASFERGKKAANALIKSMMFSQPQGGESASEGINQPWAEYLKGKSLSYTFAEGNFSDKDIIHLCPDGKFTRLKSTTSGSPSSKSGDSKGTWKATGQNNEGSLTLTDSGGTQTVFQLQYKTGTKGLGLYLDGYRYYVDSSHECR